MKIVTAVLGLLVATTGARAQSHHHGAGGNRGEPCGEMEVWDITMGMCMPVPMKGMPMRMAMVHGSLFGVGITEQGHRSRNAFAAPNWVMADIGTSIGDFQYINLEFMGTLERWTFPDNGYPELLQVGEEKGDGTPFIDAQHPHSSPVMGLTLSDTIAFSEKIYGKFFFSPRGQSTDGPVAFMHRSTGMINPDAPLGHHVGQDVGHITSTVLGTSLKIHKTEVQFSAFHGTEPEPTKVDLPLGKPNSFAGRVVQEICPQLTAMASVAYVKDPEHDDPTLDHLWRYSTSLYFRHAFRPDWSFDNTLIIGVIRGADHIDSLTSIGEEFLFTFGRPKLWGRVEILQRTASQLNIASAVQPTHPEWVSALTFGYTHSVWRWSVAELAVGASATADILPAVFADTYGGSTLWTGKIFLQTTAMRMWAL